MAAPNSPCASPGTYSRHLEIIYSYSSSAISGLPALMKDGRFPCLQSAYKVNCEMINNSPLTEERFKLVLSFTSLKIRRCISLCNILSAISLVSVLEMPTNTHNPWLIAPTIFPSIVTLALFTL